MAFHEQSFATRFESMGDEAEGVFETVYRGAYARYGLNRPPIQVKGLHPFIRYTPDYISSHHLIEVQGFGSDNKVKFKRDKLAALVLWHDLQPVMLFLYHRQSESFCFVHLPTLLGILAEHGEDGEFNDGNVYVACHKRHFQWTRVDERDKQQGVSSRSSTVVGGPGVPVETASGPRPKRITRRTNRQRSG